MRDKVRTEGERCHDDDGEDVGSDADDGCVGFSGYASAKVATEGEERGRRVSSVLVLDLLRLMRGVDGAAETYAADSLWAMRRRWTTRL